MEKNTILHDLKKLLHYYETDSIMVFQSRNERMYEGICIVCLGKSISIDTTLYISKNVPRAKLGGTYRGYSWSMYSKRGRIAWLKKHIELLENQGKIV